MPKKNRSHMPKVCKQVNRRILADRIQAELVLESIQLNSRRTIHDECRSYPCKFGNHWHLTSEVKHTEIQDFPYSA